MQTAQAPAAQTAPTPQEFANSLLLRYANSELAKAQAKETLKRVEEGQAALRDELKAWADGHASEFEGKKSLALPSGTIGFKKEGERLVWDLDRTPEDYEAKLMKLVQAEQPSAVVPTVDKKQLLKAWCVLPTLRKKLEKLGLMTRNDENFYIALKK